MDIHRYLYTTALSAGSLLIIMVLYGINTGVSQQTFEIIQTTSNYTEALLNAATPLRIILGLDNIFIALYTTTIILLVMALKNAQNLLLLGIVLIAGLSGGVLDYLENHHILTMLTAAELGVPLESAEIKQQMVSSMLKWHLAYFGFFLVAYVIQPQNTSEKLFRWCLFYIQLPVGVFFYVTSPFLNGTIDDYLFYLRYINLIVGFFFFAFIFYQRSIQTSFHQNLQTTE